MTQPSPPRPAFAARISVRDIVPIIVTGVVAAPLIVFAGRIAELLSVRPGPALTELSFAPAVPLGFLVALALAGLQGPAAGLTVRRALKAWAILAIAGVAGAMASGQLDSQRAVIRVAVVLIGACGASLLLYSLRKRAR